MAEVRPAERCEPQRDEPLQASEFGTDVSGQFFASAPKKLTGPIQAMRHPHLHDRANQEAAWQAVVKISGVDFSSGTPASAVSEGAPDGG